MDSKTIIINASRWSGAALLAAFSLSVCAAENGISFSHKDWDLVCDNTLTCRAAGYADSSSTVLLTREAGPAKPVSNMVMLADLDEEGSEDNNAQGKPALMINDKSYGDLQPAPGNDPSEWQMNAAQFTAFLVALRKGDAIGFQDNQQSYEFSGEGASAVLLKMDDVQGRVGTSGALIKKGSLDESGVKAAVAAPEVRQASVLDGKQRAMTEAEVARYKPAMMKQIAALGENENCWGDDTGSAWSISRLDETHSLISTNCWMAAYNSGDIYFVVSKSDPELGKIVTTSATDYDNGVISSSMKGRGVGDCFSYQDWTWNGERFVQTNDYTSGRCSSIRAGGAWIIPSLITTLIKPQ